MGFETLISIVLIAVGSILAIAFILAVVGVRFVSHRRVGIIEKMWSSGGSLGEGRIIAMNGEAGFQARVLRGGLHFGYPCWMYRVHMVPLVTIAEGRIGYLYARDGEPLGPTQTLGRVVDSHGYQDARAFLQNGGQRGRQRAILREGVYAINTALFVVITEGTVHSGPASASDARQYVAWQNELSQSHGFVPVVIGAAHHDTEEVAA